MYEQQKLKADKAKRYYTPLNTWQVRVLNGIHDDMKDIDQSKIWPFTSYSPCPHEKSIPGDMSDVSPEELRFLKYTSSNDEYAKYEKILGGDYKAMRCSMLRSQVKLGLCGTRMGLCREADNIMKFLVEELYIFQFETTVEFLFLNLLSIHKLNPQETLCTGGAMSPFLEESWIPSAPK